MNAVEVAERVTSVVVYYDPVHNDWVAVVRTDQGMKLVGRKNGTSESALASAIMGLLAQTNSGLGIERQTAEEAARILQDVSKVSVANVSERGERCG